MEVAAKFRAIDPHVSSTRTFDSDAPVPLARLVASRALPTIAIAMSTAVAFEDTPAWEAGLRVHEAENKWLLREFLAVLGASKSYARSLSGGGVDLGLGDGLGGVLGALAGAGAGALAAGMEGIGLGDGAGADGSDGAVRVGVSAEANFAAALERVGAVAAGTAEEEEMARRWPRPSARPYSRPSRTPFAPSGCSASPSAGACARTSWTTSSASWTRTWGRLRRCETATSATAPRATRRGSITLRSPPRARPRRPRRRRNSPRRRRRSRRPAPGSRSPDGARGAASLRLVGSRARDGGQLAKVFRGRGRGDARRRSRPRRARGVRDGVQGTGGDEDGVRREDVAGGLRRPGDGPLRRRPAVRREPAAAERRPKRRGRIFFVSRRRRRLARGPRRRRRDRHPRPSRGCGRPRERETPPRVGVRERRSLRSVRGRRHPRVVGEREGLELGVGRPGPRARRLGVGAIRRGYLAEKNPGKFGGWSRRFFVLDGAGRFLVHGRRKARARGAAAEGGAGPEGGGRASTRDPGATPRSPGGGSL